MKIRILQLLILSALLISGCSLNLRTPAGPAETTTATSVSQSDTAPTLNHTTQTTAPPTGSTQTTPASIPAKGILSDPAEYGPGNPKSHAAQPVPRDLALLEDKTREEDEVYREIFEDHLKQHYPEYSFRVIDIMNFQSNGTTFKRSRGYAAQSQDIAMDLYYDGAKVFDSFQQDVVERGNTMDRWRMEYRRLLEPLTLEIIPLKLAYPDVSFDHFEDSWSSFRLDEPFDPESAVHPKTLDLYLQRDGLDRVQTSDAASQIFQKIHSMEFRFNEYYLNQQSESGNYLSYQIPLRLIGNQSLTAEIEQVLSGADSAYLIKTER